MNGIGIRRCVTVMVMLLGMCLATQAVADFKRDYGSGRKALNLSLIHI